MSKSSTFAGLQRLLLGSGSKAALSAEQQPPAGEEEEEQEEEEQGPAPTPAPSPAPAPVEEEEEEQEEQQQEEAPAANTSSADYQAGVTATNARWAGVLLSDDARANLPLATDLLADTNWSAEKIVDYCSRHKSTSTRDNRLRTLDQGGAPKLGVPPKNGGASTTSAAGANDDADDEAAQARKAAVQSTNSRMARTGGARRTARQQRDGAKK